MSACAKSMPFIPGRLSAGGGSVSLIGPRSTTTGPKLAHFALLACALSVAFGWRGTSCLSGACGEASASNVLQNASGRLRTAGRATANCAPPGHTIVEGSCVTFAKSAKKVRKNHAIGR